MASAAVRPGTAGRFSGWVGQNVLPALAALFVALAGPVHAAKADESFKAWLAELWP